jgi:hypothetical protein
MRTRRRTLLGLALAYGCLLTGCDDPGGALLYVFSTHHATPEDGMFPFRGAEDMPRSFENDTGWTVTLLEPYITISTLTIVACDGTAYPLEMFWGPCPEDLREEDLDILTVAGAKMPPGDYCELTVGYGPYHAPEVGPADEDTRHDIPSNADIDGTTVYLAGGASLGSTDEDPVMFELKNDRELTVELDLSDLGGPGVPLSIGEEEAFPKELTVSKTYDRFLDGVDFSSFDPDDVEDELDNVLRDATRVQEGPQVKMFDPDDDD